MRSSGVRGHKTAAPKGNENSPPILNPDFVELRMVRRKPDIPVGTRFKLSKLGEARNPRLERGAEGTIVGGSRYKSSLRVVIDGRKTPLSMHRDYIDPITPNAV